MIQTTFVVGVTALYAVLYIIISWPSFGSEVLVDAPNNGEESTSAPVASGGASRSYADVHNKQKRSFSTLERQAKIVEMTKHSWDGYAAAAWGHDEVQPVSNRSSDKWGHTAVTAFDAIDTLAIMGLTKEMAEAVEMTKDVSFSSSWKASVFETNIRHVGGMLGAHTLTGDKYFLKLAKKVADGLMGGFNRDTGIAYHQVAFGTQQRENEGWSGRKTILAEAGTLQMEFRHLSRLVGDETYGTQAERFTHHLLNFVENGWPNNASHYEDDAPRMPHVGFWPAFVDPETGKFSGATSFASLSDSFYEYLLKQWILFGKKDDGLLLLYENAVEGLLEHSLHYTHDTHYAYVGHHGIGFEPTLDHLTCFVPGMLILGVMHGAHTPARGKQRTRWWGDEEVVAAAIDLASTCYRLYLESPTHIGPEVVRFEADGSYTITNPKYILRPETLESIFYLYRFTEDEKYRDWGWNIAQAIEKWCRTDVAFSEIDRVDVEVEGHNNGDDKKVTMKDRMESFWFAETLKYLYLLFSDTDIIPLDQFVFNTEGHPLPIQ